MSVGIVQAQESISRLAADLDAMPPAERSKTGTPSVREFLDQWSARIDHTDMDPNALPDLYARQATRYAHSRPDVSAAIDREERSLRGGYGASWWYGRRPLD